MGSQSDGLQREIEYPASYRYSHIIIRLHMNIPTIYNAHAITAAGSQNLSHDIINRWMGHVYIV